jgi:hypothetical protein
MHSLEALVLLRHENGQKSEVKRVYLDPARAEEDRVLLAAFSHPITSLRATDANVSFEIVTVPTASSAPSVEPFTVIDGGAGGDYASWKDVHGRTCSVQATIHDPHAVMLGLEDSGGRMRLNREMIARLLPLLERFLTAGKLERQEEAA